MKESKINMRSTRCCSITINVYRVDDLNLSIQEIEVDKHENLFDKFGKKTCQIGDMTLDNGFNFGDYQFNNINALFVYQSKKFFIKKCIVSQWKSDTKPLSDWSIEDKNRWKKQSYCLNKGRILQIDQKFQEMVKQRQINHILVIPKSLLYKIQYLYNIKPFYEEKIQKLVTWFRQFQLPPNYKNITNILLTKQEVSSIYLYTGSTIYREFNSYLRNNFEDGKDKQQWLTLLTTLSNGLSKLSNYRGIFYRGMSNVKIQYMLEGRERYLTFNHFISTSPSKQKAAIFSNNGAIITYKIIKGKEIAQYSMFSNQNQIVISPFSFFAINSYNTNSNPQALQLEEIPMPQTTRQNLVFWVDDQPEKNQDIIQLMNAKCIEVVQVLSTRIMRIILDQFFPIFRLMGKKIVIISNMTRFQDERFISQAGVDLFEIIYKVIGLSCKAIIHTSRKNQSLSKIKRRGMFSDQWIVIERNNNNKQILYTIDNQFHGMQSKYIFQ